jgi:hypothetical protein
MSPHNWSHLYSVVDEEMRARGITPPLRRDDAAMSTNVQASVEQNGARAGMIAPLLAFIALAIAYVRRLVS